MEGDFEQIFQTDRIPDVRSCVLVVVYFPIGVALVLFRICLLINFIVARQLLRLIMGENHTVFNLINWIYMIILGVKVNIHGGICTSVLISNQKSNFDGFILSHALNILSEDKWKLKPFLHRLLQLEHFSNVVAGKTHPMVVFPEGCPSSGCGILKFMTSYFTSVRQVQIVTIKTSRLMPISLSTATSTWKSDLLWTLFSPLTTYSLQLSERVVRKDEDDGVELVNTAMDLMSNILSVPVLTISHQDKDRYLDLKKKDSHKPYKGNIKLLEMAGKIQEVVPHVPRNVILNDLAKTNSIDVTLTNIFEGVVKFTPIRPNESKTPKDVLSPRSEFEKRKAEIYESARKRFIEKHNL